MSEKRINDYIDQTVLKPISTKKDIDQLINDAKKYKFFGVCINGFHIPYVKKALEGSGVKIVTVIGFPLGMSSKESKILETKDYLNKGADEIDMVINVSALKDKDYEYIKDEISSIKEVVGNKVLKVIIETSLLNEEEIRVASELSSKAGADYVKTSTGFQGGGASIEDVKIMKSAILPETKIKASGGVRDYETAKAFIDLGVDRIGTSSGVNIVKRVNGTASDY